jgi:hypothetical protein
LRTNSGGTRWRSLILYPEYLRAGLSMSARVASYSFPPFSASPLSFFPQSKFWRHSTRGRILKASLFFFFPIFFFLVQTLEELGVAEYFARNNVFQVDVSRLRHTAAASPQSAPRHSPLGMRICGGGFPTCCRCVSAMHVSPRVVRGVLVIHPRHKQLTVEIEEYACPFRHD